MNTKLLVTLKYPEVGRVKTRLAADLGDNTALALYECFVSDVLDAARQSGLPTTIYGAPPERLDDFPPLFGSHFDYKGQKGRDLGERMKNAFLETFDEGAEAALLIGGDLPEMTAEALRTAAKALLKHPAVIIPAGDGGYCCIGFRRESFVEAAFEGIPWSTADVLDATLDAMARKGVHAEMLETVPDIDTLDDLPAAIKRADGKLGPRTTTWLKENEKRLFNIIKEKG